MTCARPFHPAFIAAAFLITVTSTLSAQTLEFDELLVIERVGRGGRAAVHRDPVEAAWVRGSWTAPAEGDVVENGGDPRTWRRLSAGEDGWFEDRALRGGYAWGVVTSETERVALLDARGHRHVFVNGVPRGGDGYNLGWTRLPVQLRAGENTFLFRAGRGRLRAKLVDPPAPFVVEDRDPTLPDVIRGERETLHLGVIVSNTEVDPRRVPIEVRVAGGGSTTSTWTVPAVGQRKLPLAIPPSELPREIEGDSLEVTVKAGGHHERRFELRVRAPHEKHRRTFVSEIDGSVQYYAVTPPPPLTLEEKRTPRLKPSMILTLHGASVEADNQARCFQSRPGVYVVAPTNRRPYGFDWEDWGRLDALEVLQRAERRFGTDPRRTYLTGHSMGGHGTWSIGALFPTRFAAIGPSAGWRDFASYGGHPSWSESEDPVERMLDRAQNASRTLLHERNLATPGIYILHGDADRNVPVEQARFMRERLAAFHRNWAYYEQPGAGHWWGDRCVDWPPMFDFFGHNQLPELAEVRSVDFTTVHPGMSARCHWVSIEQQQQWMTPSRVVASVDTEKRRFTVTTENVRTLRLDLAPLGEAGGEVAIEIDGATLAAAGDAAVRLQRRDGDWRIRAARVRSATAKWPERAGPLKDAFRHRVLFVVGTTGTPEESVLLYDRARYDAETFQYRGNGSIEIVRDLEFDPTAEPERNAVLYGNRETNAAWKWLVHTDEIDVRRGAVRIGDHTVEGDDLAVLMVLPRGLGDPEGGHGVSPNRSVGIVAGTGSRGVRLSFHVGPFISGAGFPDWIIYGPEMLEVGVAGVRGTGYFGPEWTVAGGDAAWAER